MRSTYVPEDFGQEVAAPSGYYVPLEEAFRDCRGKQLLYVLGTACVEASCCGVGSWGYVRVEGFVAGSEGPRRSGEGPFEIDTIDDAGEREEISGLLRKEYPSARIEFR